MKALSYLSHSLQFRAVKAVIILIAGLSTMALSATSLGQAAITPARAYAAFMYQRLGGVTLPIDSPILVTMEAQITSGDLVGAANTVIANEPNFYNVTVREFGAIMSTVAELPNAPTSDMVADVIGVTRDGVDARQLVSGNFWYQADPTKVPNLPMNPITDLLSSNNHYQFLDTNNINIGAVLKNVGPQMYLNAAGTAQVANPDPAGTITSRAFMIAHTGAGTNRQLVKYPFREFECTDIADFAGQGPDAMIGRDVDRFPGGDNNVFQNTCKQCHNRLDGMRPAFAMFDTDTNINFVEYALFNPTPGQGQFDGNNIAVRENRNSQVFPTGYTVTSSAWVNNAVGGEYQSMFGWHGAVTGAGANQFGQMIGASDQFPRCMAQRVFQSVCKRIPNTDEAALLSALGVNFSGTWGYNLKTLYANVAALPNCLGTPQ